jgi:hypothetical protein
MVMAITLFLWTIALLVFLQILLRWYRVGIEETAKKYETLIRRTFYLDDHVNVIQWLDGEFVNQTNQKLREEAWSLVCEPAKQRFLKEDEELRKENDK